MLPGTGFRHLPQSSKLAVEFGAGEFECGRSAVGAVVVIVAEVPLSEEGFHLFQ